MFMSSQSYLDRQEDNLVRLSNRHKLTVNDDSLYMNSDQEEVE